MRKFYHTITFFLGTIFSFFENGYTLQQSIISLENLEEPLVQIYCNSEYIREPKVEVVEFDGYNCPEEEWTVPNSLLRKSSERSFEMAIRHVVFRQILPALNKSQKKIFEDVRKILVGKTSFQQRYNNPDGLYTAEVPYENLTILFQMLGKEIADIAKELKNSSTEPQKKFIIQTKETAISSFIKSCRPYFEDLKRQKQCINNPKKSEIFSKKLNFFIENFKSSFDYSEYIKKLQDSIVLDQIISILESSKTPHASINVKNLTLFYNLLRNQHPLQKVYPNLLVGQPHHSWFKIIVGWQCLLKRLEDVPGIPKDDDLLELELGKTLKLHEKTLEKLLKILQDFPRSSIQISIHEEHLQKINELVQQLNTMTQSFKKYYPCDKCLPTARYQAFGENDQNCH